MQKKESTNKATNSLYELYCALGIAIGEVVTHPDCPAWFHNELTAVVSEAVNFQNKPNPIKISLDSFATAYDGPGIKQSELEDQNKKLEDAITKKKEDFAKKLKEEQDKAKAASGG